MYNVAQYIQPPVAPPTDPALAFPIFRNTDADQLRAGAELKATQAGYQGAHSPHQFGGAGEFEHVQELAAALGGPNPHADGTLPASIRALLGREPKEGREAAPATTPRTHRTLGGFTPAPTAAPFGARAPASRPGGGRTLTDDMHAEGRDMHAERGDGGGDPRDPTADGHGARPSAAERAIAEVQDAAIRNSMARSWAGTRGMFPHTFAAIHGDQAPSTADGTRLPLAVLHAATEAGARQLYGFYQAGWSARAALGQCSPADTVLSETLNDVAIADDTFARGIRDKTLRADVGVLGLAVGYLPLG